MLQILNKKVKNGANIEFCIDLEMIRKMSEHQFFLMLWNKYARNIVTLEAFLAGTLNISSGEDYQAALK